MAKAQYVGVNSVARKVKQPYIGVDGVARKVKNGYVGVGGVARQYFQSGTPIGTLSVGTSVYMNVNGVRKEFLIVNQGRPSTTYDSSCDGTWLLMKDIYTNYRGSNVYNDYEISLINTYLKNTFMNLLDSGVRSVIKTVKIPYVKGHVSDDPIKNPTVSSGASGFSTKIFVLSRAEVGFTAKDYHPMEGAVLSYFSGASDSTRIAKLNGTAAVWWLRSPWTIASTNFRCVNTTGAETATFVNDTTGAGVRPAFVVPSTTLVDSKFNVIA